VVTYRPNGGGILSVRALTHGGGCGSVAADRILLAVGDGAHVDGLHFTVF